MKFLEVFKNSLFISMNESGGKLQVIQPSEARSRNERKEGIFFTIQGFKNNRRIMENLTNINAWAIDLDSGTKEEQEKRIKDTPLIPSMVVETKRGFHVYWFAKNATPENYRIITDKLVEKFRADKNAKDLCRILRVPGFNHWKDPNDPFKVSIAHRIDKFYSEQEMMFFFASKKEETNHERREQPRAYKQSNRKSDEDYDCKEGLRRLSGTSYVNGEQFEFRPNANGTEQIVVDGKPSSCWIDKNGLIGSSSNGGPYLWHWVKWYGYDNIEAMRIIREVMK